VSPVSPHAALGGVALVVVAAAITGGLWLIGSPAEARLERLDERRVEDLRRLSTLVDAYWRSHRRLPGSIAEVRSEPGVAGRDPVTGQPYEFRATGERQYELCAFFDRKSVTTEWSSWSHGAGRTCFPIEVRAGSSH
jgi:hypothetical protein